MIESLEHVAQKPKNKQTEDDKTFIHIVYYDALDKKESKWL